MTSASLPPGQLAQVACLLEVTARKPGNVHREKDFTDTSFLDFLLSAAAIAGPLDRAPTQALGTTILDAVIATQRFVTTNTNLGMILLLAPLAAVAPDVPLREGVAAVLAATTVDDTRAVYRAIRLARPGGLGSSAEEDVADEPCVTLVEAMRIAADRDLIARQYAQDFANVFDDALAALRGWLDTGHALETAIVGTHLSMLAQIPDTLIARKRGVNVAQDASRRASSVLAAGWPSHAEGRMLAQALDDWLRDDGNARNPGATADLISAALFAALRDGTIALPRPGGPSGWRDLPVGN